MDYPSGQRERVRRLGSQRSKRWWRGCGYGRCSGEIHTAAHQAHCGRWRSSGPQRRQRRDGGSLMKPGGGGRRRAMEAKAERDGWGGNGFEVALVVLYDDQFEKFCILLYDDQFEKEKTKLSFVRT
ncbi:hypothetical protein OsJ_11162 [Oryza sativa Japonica Group]|uniref:Uncharacterized protein n=1 Tax=Oryza sativa subsp. japonica TaxID=39947 RepID=B9F8W0_ORYSJ|nr:hypothetical protein OsJ_11162 [Oryza sativa Japonica Group]